MKEHEIVSAVRQSARIDNHQQAERAAQTVLRVLGRRLAGGESKDLAARLPDEYGELLARGPVHH